MQANRREDEKAGVQELLLRARHDRSGDQNDGGHGNERQRGDDIVELRAEGLVNEHARSDREKDDLHDREEHRGRIDGKPFAREEPHEGGRCEGSQERRARGDRDGKRHVAARQERHNVRSGTARAATEKHQTHREFGRKVHHEAKDVGRDRHDDELPENAQDDVARTAHDLTEVGGRERKTHPEHDDAEQNRNVGSNEFAGFRENEADHARNDDEDGKEFVGQTAERSENLQHGSYSLLNPGRFAAGNPKRKFIRVMAVVPKVRG